MVYDGEAGQRLAITTTWRTPCDLLQLGGRGGQVESASLRPASPRLSAPRLAVVSTLWTPEGEHRVPRAGQEPEAVAADETLEATAEEAAEELAELTRSLLAAPVEDVIANHCYGLFELAALHLSQSPANLAAARTAIDAMSALVDGLGERLGSHRATLADGLNQVRLAFVKIAEAPPSPSPADRSE